MNIGLNLKSHERTEQPMEDKPWKSFYLSFRSLHALEGGGDCSQSYKIRIKALDLKDAETIKESYKQSFDGKFNRIDGEMKLWETNDFNGCSFVIFTEKAREKLMERIKVN